MIIPPEKLTEEAIRGIVEAYVLREGTDYGAKECSLEEKVRDLIHQVITGEVLVVYDERDESVNLLSRYQLAKRP